MGNSFTWLCLPALLSFFVAGLWTCHGKVSAQLDAQSVVAATESNVVWQAFQGAYLVGDASDWCMTNNIIENKTGATTSPLVFSNAAHGATARYMVMVVKTAPTLRMRETLVCGKIIFRLDGAPANEPEGNETAEFERGGWCEVASHKINGVEGAALEAAKRQIVEVDLEQALKLEEVALCSDWGRREWRRGFSGDGGGLHEIIAFETVPSEDALVAVRRYLDVKWGLQLDTPRPTSAQVSAAMAEGAHLGNLFGTLFIVR